MGENNDQWGVGNATDAKAFDTVKEGELIFGQYPHSRQDNNMYLRRKDGDITAFDGFRRLVDINIKSTNYMKSSGFSGDEVRKRVTGTVSVDGVQLVEEFGRDPIEMMRRLEGIIQTYYEHESDWFSKSAREKLIGRKIWYHDQPATICGLIEDQGCIMIAVGEDYTIPRRELDDDFDKEEWKADWRVGDHYEIKDEVLSPHIWWWRD